MLATGSIVAVLGVLKFMGFDPSTMLAGMLVTFIMGYLLPDGRKDIALLLARLKGVKSETVQASIVPMLENLDKSLAGVDRSNPTLNSVAQALAQSVVSAAIDPTHAKVISINLAKQLDTAVTDRISEMKLPQGND